MTQFNTDPPERVKKFIFFCIDSAEQLETLLLLHGNPSRAWTADSLAQELRSSASSTALRVASLRKLGFLEEAQDACGEFRYRAPNPELHEVVTELSERYKHQRYRILALVFSPMKKARDFADSFVLGRPGSNEDDKGDKSG